MFKPPEPFLGSATVKTKLTQLFSLSTPGMANSEKDSSIWTVLILLFCLLGLIILLVFLYKKLNREAEGEYTIQRMVFKEGGVRDRVRGMALALESRLAVRLWPGRDENEFRVEMGGIEDEEGQAEDTHEEEDDAEQRSKTEEQQSTSSDDDSSLEDLESGEQIRLTSEPARVEKEEEKEEKKEEEAGAGGGKGEASGGAGLLIDLKQFSGSATWSAEEVSEVSDVTQL